MRDQFHSKSMQDPRQKLQHFSCHGWQLETGMSPPPIVCTTRHNHPCSSTKSSSYHSFFHETQTNFLTRWLRTSIAKLSKLFLMFVGSMHSNIFELGKFSIMSLRPEMQILLLKFGRPRLRWIPDGPMGNAPWFGNLLAPANAPGQRLWLWTGLVLVLFDVVIFYASNEMPLLRFHALGNKTGWIGHSPCNPWWYLAKVALIWVFDQSTLLGLPRVIEISKANIICKKGFYRTLT